MLKHSQAVDRYERCVITSLKYSLNPVSESLQYAYLVISIDMYNVYV